MRLTWTLVGHGWARITVADARSSAEHVASYISDGPEQFVGAVARLALGAEETRADLQAEPDVYRWIFQQNGGIRLLRNNDDVVWRSTQPVATLARVVLRAFDAVLAEHGEDGYEARWGRPFPARELTVLRREVR